MARKIYLHAGKHKTGTTSVQWYLAKNQQFFIDAGIGIVRDSCFNKGIPVRNDLNNFMLAHIIIRSELMTPQRLRGRLQITNYQEQCNAASQANEFLHGLAGKALVISAEAFSFLRNEKERHIYEIMFKGFDMCPIVFFREKHSWLRSWKMQTTRLRKKFLNTDQVAGGIFDYSDSSWLVDDQAIKQFFGSNTRALSYEEEQEKHGNILPAFLNELGLSPENAPCWKGFWRNRTMYD